MAKREGKGEMDHSAAHPEGWPGIKGRSHEHESASDEGGREAKTSDVTDQQRKLEEEQERVGRK